MFLVEIPQIHVITQVLKTKQIVETTQLLNKVVSGSGGNSANQGIGQSQSSNQNAQCVGGGNVADSCNNTSTQNQANSGNNAAAQKAAVAVVVISPTKA